MAETLGMKMRRNANNPFHFPLGYKVRATQLGDAFPGFTNDIIPLVMSGSTSLGGAIDSATASVKYNNVVLGSFTGGGGWYDGGSRYEEISNSSSKSGSASFYGMWLPYAFGYDYNAIKNSVKTGTCTVWLDKRGGIKINPVM